METIETLDVTVIEPRLKHPTIFQKFDALVKGEAFIIHNDHDPKPLYYQLLAERGNTFTWQYLQEGPEFWEVQISKLKSGEAEQTIGELVTKDFRRAEVFKKFGLDFCCGGKKTLTKACNEQGLDVLQIEKELKAIEQQPIIRSQDFNSWELDFLVDYIINTHHKYIVSAMPIIHEYTQKVKNVHGQNHPEAIVIANDFETVIVELNSHMMKEEKILFPIIKELVAAKRNKTSAEPSHCGSVQGPITVMEMEHETVGEILGNLNQMTNGFTPPEDACTTYRLAYAKLKEFEDDLHQHIHLENNILFPKAMELEREMSCE